MLTEKDAIEIYFRHMTGISDIVGPFDFDRAELDGTPHQAHDEKPQSTLRRAFNWFLNGVGQLDDSHWY